MCPHLAKRTLALAKDILASVLFTGLLIVLATTVARTLSQFF